MSAERQSLSRADSYRLDLARVERVAVEIIEQRIRDSALRIHSQTGGSTLEAQNPNLAHCVVTRNDQTWRTQLTPDAVVLQKEGKKGESRITVRTANGEKTLTYETRARKRKDGNKWKDTIGPKALPLAVAHLREFDQVFPEHIDKR